jgi:hypothetical protein
MSNQQLALGLLINLAAALVVIRGIYYPRRGRQEYVLAFFTFNTVVFLVASLLGGIELSIGFGIGLFAIFRMFRYRTDPIPVREMTYLFVVMALPVINAVLLSQSNYPALLMANAIIALVLYIGEKQWSCRYDRRQSVTYERIEWIKPENRDRLLADLRERTGLPVTGLEIEHINFLRDVAEIQVYYGRDPAPQPQRQRPSPGPVAASE